MRSFLASPIYHQTLELKVVYSLAGRDCKRKMVSIQRFAKVVLQGFSRAYGASKEKKVLRIVCAKRTQSSTLFLFRGSLVSRHQHKDDFCEALGIDTMFTEGFGLMLNF